MRLEDPLVRELEKYGQVLSVQLVEEEEPLVFKRDKEVEMLERQFDQAKNCSFVLLGPSGCGKTAILREFFRRVSRRTHEPWLILETSTTQMLSGTVYIGEWQTRLQNMIDSAKRKSRVAVFFNDIFHVVGAGTTSKSDENMGDALAPFVESGDFVLIGECTPDLYRKGIERHSKFKKLFTVLKVKEHSADDVEHIVEKVAERSASKLKKEYGLELKFPVNTLKAIQSFGEIYFPGSAPPYGAINLIDLITSHKTEELSKLDGGPPATSTLQKAATQPIGYEDVIRTLESFTGIPGKLLDDSQSLNLNEVDQFFQSRVLGQEEAVRNVVDVITLIKAGLTDPGKPMNVMFFIGPTGVGKTELAKAVAEYIFGSPDRMIRFDMSEFKDYLSFQKLIGDQTARDNSAMQAGSLLTKVRQQPFSVILLDEIEKAHPNIFDLLLQLFDDGRLSDSTGSTTNFTQTIIIMTSNLGSNLATPPALGFKREEIDPQEKVQEAMEDFFRPEFLNRIDRIIRFQPLKREDVKTIAQRELGQVLVRTGITRRDLSVDWDPGVIDVLVRRGFSELYGARPLKRAVEELVLLPIARQIVHMTGQDRQSLLRLVAVGDRIQVRPVKDRSARKAESLEQGVTVHDPIKGTRAKLKPRQIQEQLDELGEVIVALEDYCAAEGLDTRKSALVEATQRVNFWDDQVYARETIGELRRLEKLLHGVVKVREQATRLQEKLNAAQLDPDKEKLTEVVERLFDVRQHAQLVEYSLRCRDKLDRCDAFLVISAAEEKQPDDTAGQLADMYLAWAKMKGFETTIVHEDLQDEKTTRKIAVLVEGVAIYGLLKHEQGMHEIVNHRKTAKSAKASQFVKVRVLPLLEDAAAALPASELTVTSKGYKGNGLRCKKYRSQVNCMHQPTLTSVEARSDLSVEEASELALEYLGAELHYLNVLKVQDAGINPVEDAVRRYTIKPDQQVKDLRTGVTTTNLQSVWAGHLDEFLNASLLKQTPSQHGSPS